MNLHFNSITRKKRIDVFDLEECQLLKETIFQLRPFWIRRMMSDFKIPLGFWTLGYATYLDGPEGHEKSRTQMNAFLMEHFASLYEKVRSALRSYWRKR